jgi:chromosome segregation ATPase
MTARPLTVVRSLDERIAAAFEDGATSDDIADLIREAEAASVAAGQASDAARQRALNPRLVAGQVAASRRESEDAAFSRDRMQEAVRRLGERLAELRRQEDNARRRADRGRVEAERDKLAAELAERYPPLVEQLADLAARIAANDAEIARLQLSDVPGAEPKARGFAGFNVSTMSIPRITELLRLPAFKYEPQKPFAWPPTQR